MSSQARRGAIFHYTNLLLIMVAGVFVTPFIVQKLGGSQYGLYSLMGGIIPCLALLDMGMSQTVNRYIAYYRAEENRDDESRFIATAMRIYGVIVAMIVATGVLVVSHIDRIWGSDFTRSELNDLRQMLTIVFTAYTIIIPSNAFTAMCNGMGLFAFPRGIELVKYVVRTASVVALLVMGGKAVALIALDVVLNVLVAILTYLYVRGKIARRSPLQGNNSLPAKPIVQYSLWIALYSATCAMQWHSGQIVAGMTSSASMVGVMGIGILLGYMYSYFAETINRMTLPHASRTIQQSTSSDNINRNMVQMGRLVAIPQMIILGGFIIFGESFITLWVGESYREAYYVATIMMSAWSIDLSQDYGKSLLQAKGSVKIVAILNFIIIFAGAIVSIFVGKIWGIIGIIVSLSAGTLVASIANDLYYRYELGLKIGNYFYQVYSKATINMVIWIVVFAVIKENLVAPIDIAMLLTGIVIYCIITLFTTYTFVLTRQERGWLKDKLIEWKNRRTIPPRYR